MKLAKYLLLVLFISIAHIVFSQEPPFWNDIQSFKKQDSVHMPPQHEILFVGSSSFTKWTDVQNYFPDHPIINRGFGGSTLLDASTLPTTFASILNCLAASIICCAEDSLVKISSR